MGIPEAEERKKAAKEMFEVILAEYFPKLITDRELHIQEAQKTNKHI